VKSGFQSLKPLTSLDTLRLGYTARFNLSAMDLPVSINDRFQVPLAVGQLLLSARTADLLKDGEIFNFNDDDNDLLFMKQIVIFLKWAKLMINFIGDDDDNREDDDGDFIKVN
jgi:hypothetical protein